MFMDRVEEIHVTEVQTNNSGDVFFPKWDRSWSQQLIETVGLMRKTNTIPPTQFGQRVDLPLPAKNMRPLLICIILISQF